MIIRTVTLVLEASNTIDSMPPSVGKDVSASDWISFSVTIYISELILKSYLEKIFPIIDFGFRINYRRTSNHARRTIIYAVLAKVSEYIHVWEYGNATHIWDKYVSVCF